MMAGCGGRKRLRFEERPSSIDRGSRPRNMPRQSAGGVQRLGDQLRVTARIVNVETGVVLDTVMVDGRFDKMFAVQDRAGARLAARLVSVSDGDAAPLAGIAVPESEEGCSSGRRRDLERANTDYRPAVSAYLLNHYIYSWYGCKSPVLIHTKMELYRPPDFVLQVVYWVIVLLSLLITYALWIATAASVIIFLVYQLKNPRRGNPVRGGSRASRSRSASTAAGPPSRAGRTPDAAPTPGDVDP